jgi:hypothetical protein
MACYGDSFTFYLLYVEDVYTSQEAPLWVLHGLLRRLLILPAEYTEWRCHIRQETSLFQREDR